ncbi:LamG-like jellyroll fold domain-containing protein [Winogradskyella psychrotolerans]|uniref:LamG-like jellyroll fold domain-containing protein n=1 Tax=Winogradskyella psychrotolerans TaxID=1344585 RepID=UPI001C0765D2|nr:LamG-like jellyroll fold domain-containing protein [Winogradskyella psychrotolerans]MBU2930163.1 hypothetical protein [Winogradskyella psychrotolerans]
MKKSILILILIILISCSSDNSSDNNTNNSPSNFDISVSEITRISATITWTESIDPENEVVKYDVYLDENLTIENTLVQNYNFINLEINTLYNGKVIAKDEFGNTLEKQFSFTTETISCIPDELQNEVIAFYPFNNGSLNDIVNFNILTNNTSANSTSDRNSNENCAFEFNTSTNDFLTTTDTDFLNDLSEFSISLWFNPRLYWNWNYNVLVSRDEGFSCPDTYGQWSLGLYDLNRPTFGHLNSVWDQSWDSDNDYNNWHHLVATYNEINNSLSLYRNGILEGTITDITSGCSDTPTSEDIGDLIIGKNFDGKLDDIAIFNVELNQAQVTELFEIEPCCE